MFAIVHDRENTENYHQIRIDVNPENVHVFSAYFVSLRVVRENFHHVFTFHKKLLPIFQAGALATCL